MSKVVVVLVAVAAALVAASGSHATFPGPEGRIAFASDRSGGTDNVFTMKPDGSDVRQLTFLTSAQGGDNEPAWSPDGRQLVFTEHNPDGSVWRLWVINADGSNRHPLFAESDGASDFQGNWSPDGKQVIFRRCINADEECAIYAVNTDGSGLRPLTSPTDNKTLNIFDVKPEYSSDGRTLAFASFNRGGVIGAVYTMNLGSGKVDELTPSGIEALDPDWAPDGSRIVFWTHCCMPLASGISAINPDGSGLVQLTSPTDASDLRPSYSPHGDRIAFEHDALDFSTRSIAVMNADGTGETVIQNDAYFPSWGPAASTGTAGDNRDEHHRKEKKR